MPRTGSTLLNSFVEQFTIDNGGEAYSELFLESYQWNGSKWYRDKTLQHKPLKKHTVLSKLEYLQSKENVSWKTFPYNIIHMGYSDILYDLLKDHQLLTIKRYPFHSFLSLQYQNKTKWILPHRQAGKSVAVLKDVEIELWRVKGFLNRWVKEYQFINSLPNVHSFDYEKDILNVESLNNFFHDNRKTTRLVPMNMDYRKMFSNIDYVEDIFNKELDRLTSYL